MDRIDLHCDTPLRLYQSRGSLISNNLHIDLERAAPFSRFLQCAALFCPAGIPDADGFSFVLSMAEYFKAEIRAAGNAVTVDTKKELEAAWKAGKRAFLLTVEDARILDGKIERIPLLRALGVRIVTPLWRGVSAIGGAHDTDVGLSPFGAKAMEEMATLRILPDVSHACEKSFRGIREITKAKGLPLVATHSCAAALCPHTRNLSDAQIREIAESGGVVGLNFYPPFLCKNGRADIGDLLAHLRHLFRVGGRDLPALGADFDGVDALPVGIGGIEDIERLCSEMKHCGFSEDDADRFSFQNAARVLRSVL